MRLFSGRLRRPGWLKALAVSLVLHAGLVCAVSGLVSPALPYREKDPQKHSYYQEDPEHDAEMTVRLEPRRGARPVATAPKGEPPPEARLFSPVLFEPTSTSDPAPASEGPANPTSGSGGDPVPAPLPPGATTTFFQVPARGRSIVYLIDASSSMGPSGGWEAASRELLASLAHLPPDARFQVLVYNNRVNPLLPRHPDWLPAAPNVLRQIAQALQELEPSGGTDHGAALRSALQLRGDALYFLTDADDLTAEHTRLAKQQNRGRTVIHTIEMNPHNRGRGFMPMQVLARDHGGTYQAVNLGMLLPSRQRD
jgi:hypothetical protein